MTWFVWRIVTDGAESAEPVYLGIGTNLGDRAANVRAALRGIEQVAIVAAVSDVYETVPYGYAQQPDFWNLAVKVHDAPEPFALLAALHDLETALGRTPTFRMGPRVIDIDLLLYGARVLRSPTLWIPHGGLLDRAFVLRPLLDLDATLVHPVSGERLRDRLADLADHGSVRRLGSVGTVVDTDRAE